MKISFKSWVCPHISSVLGELTDLMISRKTVLKREKEVCFQEFLHIEDLKPTLSALCLHLVVGSYKEPAFILKV